MSNILNFYFKKIIFKQMKNVIVHFKNLIEMHKTKELIRNQIVPLWRKM